MISNDFWLLNEDLSVLGTISTKQKGHRCTRLISPLTAEEGLAFWEWQRPTAPFSNLPETSQLLSFSLTLPFSSSSTFFSFSFLKGDSPNKMPYSLTISVNHSPSFLSLPFNSLFWKKTLLLSRQQKCLFLSFSLYFLQTIHLWPSSILPFAIEAEHNAKLNKGTLHSSENTLRIFWIRCQPLCVCNQSKLLWN